MHLALSILHHGFPTLDRLRAPQDMFPRGILQSVCRPAPDAKILLQEDVLAMRSGEFVPKKNSNNLQMARLRAQKIIYQALLARQESAKALVTEHSILPSRHEVVSPDGVLTASTSRSSQLTRLTTNSSTNTSRGLGGYDTPVERIAKEVDIEGYRIGEGWDKEVVVHKDHNDNDENRAGVDERRRDDQRPTSEQRRHLPSGSPEPMVDEVKQRAARRAARNQRPDPISAGPGTSNSLASIPALMRQQSSSSSTSTHLDPPLPPRSPLRTLSLNPTSSAVQIKEFSLPTFTGRVSLHISSTGQVLQPPVFWLRPDVEGRDGNGGIVGWGELLRIGERAKAAQGMGVNGHAIESSDSLDRDWVEGGCDGSWNRRRNGNGIGNGARGRGKGDEGWGSEEKSERWRHMMRERGGGGGGGGVGGGWLKGKGVVRIEDFF